MKTLPSLVSGIAVAAGLGFALVAVPSFAQSNDNAPEETRVPMPKGGGAAAKAAKSDAEMAQAKEPEAKPDEDDAPEEAVAEAESETEADAEVETESESEKPASDSGEEQSSETNEEEKTMSKETTADRTPEEAEAFRQTMHEGDIALGVCGARVSALLWFYEASVSQGRDDLKAAVSSLSDSRSAIKAEAERRAVDDGVDTSVRVMNSESEKIWNDLNEKAAGDEKEFQTAHDELYNGVQECLALFFDRPGEEKEAPKAE